MNLISLAIVVYFHFVLMFYTINRQEPPKDPPPPPKKERRKDSLKIRFVEKQGSRVTACKHYYVGIGIIYSFLNDVSYVAPGGPADRAGIRVGDVINQQLNLKHLSPGTPVNIAIYRDGIIINKTIKVEKICND